MYTVGIPYSTTVLHPSAHCLFVLQIFQSILNDDRMIQTMILGLNGSLLAKYRYIPVVPLWLFRKTAFRTTTVIWGIQYYILFWVMIGWCCWSGWCSWLQGYFCWHIVISHRVISFFFRKTALRTTTLNWGRQSRPKTFAALRLLSTRWAAICYTLLAQYWAMLMLRFNWW